MTRTEALHWLGLSEGSSAEAIRAALERRRTDLDRPSAGTPAPGASRQEVAVRLQQAGALLLGSPAGRPQAPLSETQARDLPLRAPQLTTVAGSSPTRPDADLEPGQLLAGRYEVRRCLGRGGMGV